MTTPTTVRITAEGRSLAFRRSDEHNTTRRFDFAAIGKLLEVVNEGDVIEVIEAGDAAELERSVQAATESVKDLLDEWEEEATRLTARAYRNDEPEVNGASATQLRECIIELGAMFPAAKAWHEDGEVPA